jgi:hypothetical protein
MNIRFIDGSGVTTTDDSTGDITTFDIPIAFVDFGTAADTELKITTASDTPEQGVVMVDESSTTDNVVLLRGKIELEGEADATLDEFPVTFTMATTSGTTADNINDTAGSVSLKIGGNTYSETVNLSTFSSGQIVGSITFDDMDFELSAGQTVSFEVLADVEDLDGTVFTAGTTLKADVTAANRSAMDIEDEEGDQLDDSSEKSGTATGETQEFRVSGIQVTFVSASTAVTAGNSSNDDLGTFTIRYKIKAVGDTVYVSTLAEAKLAASSGTTGSTTVLPDRAGTATVGGSSVTLTNLTDNDTNSVGLYTIEEGQEETFEVTTTLQLPTAGAAGQYRVVLGKIHWDTDATDPTPDNAYTSNLEDIKTSYLGLN